MVEVKDPDRDPDAKEELQGEEEEGHDDEMDHFIDDDDDEEDEEDCSESDESDESDEGSGAEEGVTVVVGEEDGVGELVVEASVAEREEDLATVVEAAVVVVRD